MDPFRIQDKELPPRPNMSITPNNPYKFGFMRLQEFRKHPVFTSATISKVLPGFKEGFLLAVAVISVQTIWGIVTDPHKATKKKHHDEH